MKSKSEYKAEAGRRCGVLLHISSLPSPYGIGTMGRQAYQFIDFLKESGMAYWQLLPVCPTSYGDGVVAIHQVGEFDNFARLFISEVMQMS